MIVDSPVTYDLSLGQPNRIPSQDDAQLVIPPVITPVCLTTFRHTLLASTVIPQLNSFFNEAAFTRTNQAAQDVTTATLAPGLWELEFTLATWFNYSNTAAAFNAVSWALVYAGFLSMVLARIAITNQSFTDTHRMRLLLQQNTPIVLRLPVTGVGQSLDVIGNVNAIRLL